MAKPRKGDYLSCQVCGLVVVVDEGCGCAEAALLCCKKPMARGKAAADRLKKAGAAKKPMKKAAKAPAKPAAKTGSGEEVILPPITVKPFAGGLSEWIRLPAKGKVISPSVR